jgi:23S rRNA (adenine2030-N6)-methyltransferase
MLSYRHGFHAGMHADVLKHAVLVHMLQYLVQKEKPLWYIDTHAGAAEYSLESRHAKTSGEHATGISRLWPRSDIPKSLAPYLDLIRTWNPDGVLRHYPGSPGIADRLLRKTDRLRLFELHPTEIRVLQKQFQNAAPRVIAQAGDGFESLLALLPPLSRRGLVLIDPSYEDKRDYQRVIAALQGGLERFATGTYMVWYPQIRRREAQDFPQKLKRLRPAGWLHVTLTVKAPPTDGFGIYGSGVFVFNPPYTLPDTLASFVPYLARTLGQDGEATHRLECKLE